MLLGVTEDGKVCPVTGSPRHLAEEVIQVLTTLKPVETGPACLTEYNAAQPQRAENEWHLSGRFFNGALLSF